MKLSKEILDKLQREREASSGGLVAASASPPIPPKPPKPPKPPRSGGGKNEEDEGDKSDEDDENKIGISKKSQRPEIGTSSSGEPLKLSPLAAQLAELNADFEKNREPICQRLSSIVSNIIAALQSGFPQDAVAIFSANSDFFSGFVGGSEIAKLDPLVISELMKVYFAAKELDDSLKNEIEQK